MEREAERERWREAGERRRECSDISFSLPSPYFPQWLEALCRWWGRQLWERRGSAGSQQSQHRSIPLNPHTAHRRAACQNKAKSACAEMWLVLGLCFPLPLHVHVCSKASTLTSNPGPCGVQCVYKCSQFLKQSLGFDMREHLWHSLPRRMDPNLLKSPTLQAGCYRVDSDFPFQWKGQHIIDINED